MNKPFYNPNKTYEYNYKKGPFGAFKNNKNYKSNLKQFENFLGISVNLAFGIPAGPLLNSKYVKAAFNQGFDICVYKTVRASEYPCHKFPNVLAVKFRGKKLTLEKLEENLAADNVYKEPLSITNSFGVPSRDPAIWQKDVTKAMSYAQKGQVLVLSFMGTAKKSQTQQQFIDDFKLAAKLASETGAKILEVNLSCPNIGDEGLVCYDLKTTEKILKKIRSVIGNKPLITKIGYFRDNKNLAEFARIANDYANDIAAINTLPAKVVDILGKPALPGKNRLKSGICGYGIKWAGMDMVKRLSTIKRDKKLNFSITGVGGVMNYADFKQYKKVGADCVMSATGAMWNPNLAKEIKLKF